MLASTEFLKVLMDYLEWWCEGLCTFWHIILLFFFLIVFWSLRLARGSVCIVGYIVNNYCFYGIKQNKCYQTLPHYHYLLIYTRHFNFCVCVFSHVIWVNIVFSSIGSRQTMSIVKSLLLHTKKVMPCVLNLLLYSIVFSEYFVPSQQK